MFIRICPNKADPERPHVHVSLGQDDGRAKMKVWIDTMTINKTSGEWPIKRMKLALDTIDIHREALIENWAEMSGGAQPVR